MLCDGYALAHDRANATEGGTGAQGASAAPLRADAPAGLLRRGKEQPMLWTLVVILELVWLLGMVTASPLNGLLHLLLSLR